MSSRIPLPDPGRPTREEIASILAAGYMRLVRERLKGTHISKGAADMPKAQESAETGQKSP
jgi:hypothetical protein